MRDATRIWEEMADIGKIVTSNIFKLIGTLANDAEMKKGAISIRNFGMAFDYMASAMERIVRSVDKVINFVDRIGGSLSKFGLDLLAPGGSQWLPQLWGKEFDLIAPPLPKTVPSSIGAPARAGSPDVRAAIIAMANQYSIDPALALAIASKESGMNPNAPRGKAGEYGMMQMMPGTFSQYGSGNPNDFMDNLQASMNYLSTLQRQYGGNEYLMARAYNGTGPAAEDYASDVMRREQQFAVTINISVPSGDPREMGRKAAEEFQKTLSQRMQAQSTAVFVTP
jgi:hypothetical protein